MSRRSVLVTGASGFIGGHLTDRLLGAGAEVVALARPGSRLPERWGRRLRVATCADWEGAELDRTLDPFDFETAFHLAAYGVKPADREVDTMFRVNVALPATLVRLCKDRGARLVVAGTFSEYRAPTDRVPVTEPSALEDTKLYGASKAAGYLVANAAAVTLGVNLRWLRLFHTYGPNEAAHRLLPNLVTGLSRSQRVKLSDGAAVRDFVHVDDVVDALLRADAHAKSSTVPSTATWNVCTGIGHSVRDVAVMVAKIIGASAALLGFGDLPRRPDDVPWLVGSNECIARELGWRPRFALADGLRAAVAAMTAGGPVTSAQQT